MLNLDRQHISLQTLTRTQRWCLQDLEYVLTKVQGGHSSTGGRIEGQMCLGDLGILSNNSKRSKAQPGIIGLRSTAQTFTGLDCCLSPSFLAAGEPGDLKVSSLCPVDASPGRALVPGSWKPALFFSKCLCLLCLLLLPPPPPQKREDAPVLSTQPVILLSNLS